MDVIFGGQTKANNPVAYRSELGASGRTRTAALPRSFLES